MRHITHRLAILIAIFVPAFTTFAQTTSQQRLQTMIDKGLGYLKTAQKEDGGWQATPQEPPGITALALRAFAADPKYAVGSDPLKKGFEKLLSYQKDDGGIYASAQANYNTAVALVALAAVKDPAFKPRIDKAVAFVKSTQWTETAVSSDGVKIEGMANPWYGGWGYANTGRGLGRPDLSNVQMVLDALHDAGVKPDDPAYKAALVFVTRVQNHSETNTLAWAGNDGGFVYSTGEGGRGSSPAGEYTGPDGKPMLRSYGSMTYAGLKSFIYAGLTKDDARVKAAWDWISKNYTLDENPGMKAGNPQQAQYGYYYYFHTLARALNAYDQPTITDPQGKQHDWRVEVIDKLASLQKPDGSWMGEQRWMENNAVLCTAYCVIALDEIQKDLKEHPIAGR
jgi:squalene-hopene/tetraprenyl-beta-curcumene cyclase